MPRAGLFLLVAALPASAFGCSLLFNPSDFYGHDGGREEASMTDAFVDRVTHTDSAGPSDGQARDGQGEGDGGDAMLEVGPVDAGPFCKQAAQADAAFCADFDEHNWLLAWKVFGGSARHANAGGQVDTTDASAKSPPSSLRASMPAMSGSGGGEGFMENDLTTGWRSASLDLDLYVPSVPKGAGLVVLKFAFEGTYSAGMGINLGTGPPADAASTGSLELVLTPSGDAGAWKYGGLRYQADTWTHLHIDLSPDTTSGSATVFVDDAAVQSWPDIPFAADPGANTLTLQVGLVQYASFSPAFEILYDNVVVTLH